MIREQITDLSCGLADMCNEEQTVTHIKDHERVIFEMIKKAFVAQARKLQGMLNVASLTSEVSIAH